MHSVSESYQEQCCLSLHSVECSLLANQMHAMCSGLCIANSTMFVPSNGLLTWLSKPSRPLTQHARLAGTPIMVSVIVLAVKNEPANAANEPIMACYCRCTASPYSTSTRLHWHQISTWMLHACPATHGSQATLNQICHIYATTRPHVS
jgi:hypothetical protein